MKVFFFTMAANYVCNGLTRPQTEQEEGRLGVGVQGYSGWYRSIDGGGWGPGGFTGGSVHGTD